VVKWVQVDLGAELPLEEVRLYSAEPTNFPARRGFGFPVRFRVEASNDADFAQPVMLFDCTKADFVNPAENPVIIPVENVRARFIRITATKLWERTNDFIFALAELEAYSGGKNVALGATVTSLDNIEAPSWSRRFLVDGFNSQGRILGLDTWLRGLSRRREIEHELLQLEFLQAQEVAALLNSTTRWGAILLIGIGAALAWWLHRRSQNRRRELDALRQRIASDLHDEIGSNLGSIALLSQMALRQNGNASADLAEINRVARETAASMRDIVWLIRPGDTGTDDFVAKLRETAAVLLTGLEWNFDDESFTASLSLEWRREVLLLFKEALYNIRRHAGASHVRIRLAEEDGELVMQISDDGGGFDVTTATIGHGLNSQRQRAQTLGGEWHIDSTPEKGTVVTLRAKLGSGSRADHA
jgi:signal transduction histidine kinase